MRLFTAQPSKVVSSGKVGIGMRYPKDVNNSSNCISTAFFFQFRIIINMSAAPKVKICGVFRTIKYENASFGYVVHEVICKCDSCLLSNSQGQLVSDRVHRKHFKAQQIRYRQKNKKYSPPINEAAVRRFIPLMGHDLEDFLASGQAEPLKLVADYIHAPGDLSDEDTDASEIYSSCGEGEDDSDGGDVEEVEEEVNAVRNDGANFHREPLSLGFWKEGR